MEGGPITVERLLGEGGMGAVYLAHDPQGTPLALKVLKTQATGLQEMFEQEVGILSKLKHPRLVEIMGFSKEGKGIQGINHEPCFWMEYVEGKPILEACREFSTAKALDWFRESLEALEYLHSQGILHGDLKPPNLLVTREGHIKVVDFGLAALTQNLRAKSGKTKGSIPYMAPEVLDGERLAASDLFSLGTVFYEVLAGKHPRAGAKNLRSLFAPEVPKLREINQEVPSRTARVLERLLEPDLNARLKSAQDTQEALLQEEVAPAKEIDFYSFRMLGIGSQWNQFFTYKKEIQSKGGRGLVLVHGLTGVGKTRFLRDLFFEMALQGDRVLQGPARGTGGFLAGDFSQKPQKEEKPSFPVQIIPSAGKFSPPQLRRLYRFLRQPEGVPGLVVLEFNDETLGEFHQQFFGALAKESMVLDLPLKNLSLQNTKKFLQDCLRRELPEPILKELFDRTQGNPKLLTETGKEILQSGLMKKKRLTLELFQELALPKTAQEIFSQRLANLSKAEKQVFIPIALCFEKTRLEDLLALTGLNWEELRPNLNQLIKSGLVVPGLDPDESSFRLAHPSLATLMEKDIGPKIRQKIHRQWRDYLEKSLPPDGKSDLAWMAPLAFHALRTPEAKKRVPWVQQAGSLYTAQEDHEKARRIYAQCLEGEMSPEDREAMMRSLINCYGRMGRFQESLEKLEDWYREYGEEPTGLNRVKYWLSKGVGQQNQGNPGDARHSLQQCIATGELENPEHRPFLARAFSLLGLLDLQENRLKEARENFSKALKYLPEKGVQTAEVLKHRALGAAQEKDWDQALKHLKEAEAMYQQIDHPVGVFSVALERGNLALSLERLEESRQSYVEALKIARNNKDDAALARVHQNLGVLDCRRGLFHRAIEELEKAREIFTFLGSPTDRGLNLLQLALAHGSVGRFAKSDALMETPRQQHHHSETYTRRYREIQYQIATLRWGRIPDRLENPYQETAKEPPKDWDLERRLLQLMLEDSQGEDRSKEICAILKKMHGQLPDALKIGFEERGDWRRFILFEKVLPESPPGTSPKDQTLMRGKKAMDILEKVAQITKALLSTTEIEKVLVGLMDAAMDLSKAKHGFLILQSEGKKGPIPNFEVKIARNLAQDDIEKEDFKVSVSALKEAVEKGKTLVTDNALADTRFAEAESVHAMELKSILALPLKTQEGIVGALYLDHPYKTDIFQKEDLKVLEILADQAALALQKAQMISKLKDDNVELNDTVKDQASEINILKREVEDQRVKLKHEYKEVIGRSRPMVEVLSLVDRVTETMVPVWIYGESGTGKEMIARALHFNSSRAKKPFVSENCSALPETLLESELFGHKKGAFTHADRDKKGLLQHADGGTVFLDEIADMSMAMQAKLLRFLQEGEIRPLGSNQVIHVDARVVSASNRNLQKLVKEEKFREDLYYRLVGVTITLPPLRERLEDIPLLAQHFIKKIAKEEGKENLEITPEALEMLMEYPWPGNVRELENTIRTAILFHQKGKITPKSLHFKKQLGADAVAQTETKAKETPAFQPKAEAPSKAPAKTPELPEEKRLLLQALLDSGYHKGNAAKTLGISRRYLYTQLLRHQVPVNRIEMKAYIEETLGQ